MKPRELLADPKKAYFLVSTCEACGQRVRASTMLRHWSNRPRPHIEDAEIMITRGAGRGLIHNERMPLWSGFTEPGGAEVVDIVACHFGMLQRRLLSYAGQVAAAPLLGASLNPTRNA